jgi:hypothetical protein
MGTPIAGIYALEPFSTQSPTPSQQQQIAAAAAALGKSGFGNVIFASFHLSKAGDITFNDTTIASGGTVTSNLDSNLPQLIADMKAAGVGTVLASFGGGGCFSGQAIGYWDFTYLRNLQAAYPSPAANPFYQNLQAMLKYYHIDGVDIDLEVYESAMCKDPVSATYDEFLPTLANLAVWCSRNGHLVTAAPYERPDFWASVLAKSYSQNSNVQPFSLFNVQSGAGDSSQCNSFINAIKALQTGIADPTGFISAGLQCEGLSAADVTSIMAEYPGTSAKLQGGWLWNNTYMAPDQYQAYANAVLTGLKQGTSTQNR